MAVARRIKILIGEDDHSLRRIIALTLAGDEVEVLQAADGDTALDLALRELPELIFLDWQMPGLSGPAVCRAIREDPDASRARIVMLTARTRSMDRLAAFGAGADDYVTKPFSPLELLDKVHTALGPEALR